MDLLRISFDQYLDLSPGRLAQAKEYLAFKAEIASRTPKER